MKKLSFYVLFLVAAFIVAIISTCNTGPKPGKNFPADLEVFKFLNQSVVENIAHELVDGYVPVKENEPAHLSLVDEYNNPYLLGAMRWSLHLVHGPSDDLDGSKWLAVLQAFLETVGAAAKYPAAAQWFYRQNSDAVIAEMIRYAHQPVTEPEWEKRPAYTDAQIAEMFRLYADMADTVVSYLSFAGQPESQAEFVVGSLQILEGPEPDYGTPEYEADQEKKGATYNALKVYLAGKSHLDFDQQVSYETWKFGLRRMQNGGLKLLQTMIELTNDAARRARKEANDLD